MPGVKWLFDRNVWSASVSKTMLQKKLPSYELLEFAMGR